jgi:glycosyltransferase involved in cell wall biosynthesis
MLPVMTRRVEEAPLPGLVDVSVIVPTFNRCDSLAGVLESLSSQDAAGVRFEVLVVDNNSTDHTRHVVRRFAAQHPGLDLHYLFEPQQGVSHARNAGIRAAAAPLLAFIDDDVKTTSDWVATLKHAFEQHPEIDAIGGRVRSVWKGPRPAWLTPEQAGPIAVQDRPAPMVVDRRNASACLITANFACRRRVFADVGGFSGDFPRCQDRELQMRMWRAGKRGLYLPQVEVTVEVPEERTSKRYHRRWRITTGFYHAKMQYVDLLDADGVLLDEPPPRRTLFGSPLFVYRRVLTHAMQWLVELVGGDEASRFFHEIQVCYYASFLRTRTADWFRAQRPRAITPDASRQPPTTPQSLP